MGVTALIAECLQLGVPFDIAKLTTESMGMTADQVMELRLEKLLLTKKLEMRTSEALDFQKELERVSKKKEKKIIHQKQEIKNLKAELEKVKKKLGGPGVLMGDTEADDDEDFETFDWGQGEMESVLGNDGSRREEQEPARDHESQADDNGVTVNVSTSSSASAEPDLRSRSRISVDCDHDDDDNWSLVVNMSTINGSSRRKINAGNVTNVSDNQEDVESSTIQGNELASQEKELELQKIRKDSGNPNLQMESAPEADDLAEGVDSVPENGDGELEEGSALDNESHANDNGEIVDDTTPTCSYAERDLQSLQSVPRGICNEEGKESQSTRICSSAKPDDDVVVPKSQENRRNASGSRDVTILQSEASAPTKVACTQHQLRIHPRRQADDGRAKVDESTLTSGYAEHDLQPFQSHSKGHSVTSSRNDSHKAPEDSSPRDQADHLRRKRRPVIPKRYLASNSDISIPPPHKLFRCQLCSKLLKTKGRLQSHLFSIHSKDPAVFTCEPCELGYISEDELKRHKTHSRCGWNTGSSRLKCKYCSKVFISRVACYRHERMHLGKNGEMARAQCVLCPNSYSSFDNLGRHKRRHHPQQI